MEVLDRALQRSRLGNDQSTRIKMRPARDDPSVGAAWNPSKVRQQIRFHRCYRSKLMTIFLIFST
jgi:hypothetical protein